MKKAYLMLALILATIINVNAQNTEKQKADNYLSTQGELTFTFQVNNHNEVDLYSRDFSIVNYTPNTKTVIAWANERQFRIFETKNIPFEVPTLENEVDEVLIYDVRPLAERVSNRATLSFPVNSYPTYAEYAAQMQDFEDEYPTLVEKISIGITGQGDKELLFVKISDNVATDEQEPKLMLTSSMHGDEIAGYPMMLSLIDYILSVYGDTGHSDHIRIKNLVENAEIWINPSANPDGTYNGSANNTSVVNARRGNGNNIDLNRNYPDNVAGAHYDGNAYQTETIAFMNLAASEHFVISANFHGGTELVNYPFDNAYVSQYEHPDGDWFEYTGVEYATHAQTDANSGSTAGAPYSYKPSYMTVDDDSNVFPSPGVTHGAEWYRVFGGRQDYMNVSHQCKEVTIELSDTKILPESQLDDYWYYNRDALLDFLTQGTYGFRGTVVDDITGNPIDATITIVNHDDYGSHTFTDISHGDYYRPIKGGTYTLLIESPCYQSETIPSQSITDGNIINLGETRLLPGASVPNSVIASSVGSTNATIDWNAQSGNTFDLRYREVGFPTWTTITGLTTNTYDITGLTLGIQYEVQVRSICGALTASDYSESIYFTTPNIDTIHEGYFESGWDNWSDGGNRVSRYTGGTYSYENVASILIKDNSGAASTMTSEAFDLRAYSAVEMNFYFYPQSIENGESFLLEYFNGSVWTTLEEYFVNTDFNNGSFYNKSFTLNSGPYNFATNSQFRFRCNASDNNDDIYIDQVIITGTPTPVLMPEINITGNNLTIVDGDITPSSSDDTVFGNTSIGSPISKNFTIENIGSATLNVGSITFSGTNPGDFSVSSPPASTVAISDFTTFIIDFNPTANGARSAILSIVNDDSNENPYNFTIQGTGTAPLTEGPGGVTSDLALWLKGTDGLGYTDGQPVSTWADQGLGADATVNTAGQEPTYKDNVNDNVNFNPVVDFDNTYSTSTLDGDFSYDNTSTQFLEGPSGYYSQDIFTVIIPDANADYNFGKMDIFCGDEDSATNNTDATGIGLGNYSTRFTNEVFSYVHEPTGYGVAEVSTTTTYSNAGIINVRNNPGATQQELYYNANNKETTQNNVSEFENVNDARFWIGRSEGWEASTDARIAEVITYSSRKSDIDLTVERNRIMSYLAIKYGITLGINGTSQDYVNSNGDIIWDVNTGISTNDVFNYDITGIGRDDDSDLHQKQSRSVNNALNGATRGQGVLTMGISAIYDTNKLNPNTDLNDKEFLIWGNDGIDLDDPSVVVDIDMSSGITPAIPGGTNVQFIGIARTWKVVENVPNPVIDDIPSVEVSILKSAVRIATPSNGIYLMLISDDPNFDSTDDYTVMSSGTNELGEAVFKTNYDFDSTKYITFGWAPDVTNSRSVYFNGAADYIDMEDALDLNPTAFTISSWIKRDAADTGTSSIVSKRDATYTTGYDLTILDDNTIQYYLKNGTDQILTSNTSIPDDEWHHVALVYNGTRAHLYIDGVLDTDANRTAPTNTDESFYVGAAGKSTPTQHFMGNIDEVRVWNTNLTESQLRFIMNQEIEDNSNFVNGSYFSAQSITPTKNDIATIPWSDLAGYYPMTTYNYTNTKDESGNGNRGALKNLRTIDKQTAPLPYKSTIDGDWDTNATWENGSMHTIPGHTSIVDNTVTIDWNIVETNHNIIMDNSNLPDYSARSVQSINDHRTLLGLIIESNKLTLNGDNDSVSGNGLSITHYLKLDGKIDLEGESQLVQDTDSDLDVTSAGTLEKDQQGTQDTFTYNYWSSPVGGSNNAANNNSYSLNDNILKDGTDSSNPINMNFVSGYNGTSGSPIGIAGYWIWKYNNRPTDDYASWQHIRNTGTLFAGEGFTMKGATDTSGNVTLEQNYTFEGKPNNGDITVPINAGNDYLVGNPYASAIDANKFILDNTNTTGALYLWEHFGGGTHNTIEYQGGYAVYNLSGGIPAIQYDYATGGTVSGGEEGLKTPGRYIAVAQGFFVTGVSNGTINFNNDQRTFVKEDATSVFVRSSNSSSTRNTIDDADNRLKIRLGFVSSNTYKRQLLATRDSLATNQIDFGYDAVNKDVQSNDMFWKIDNEKFVIQGTNTIDASTVLPIGIITSENGINTVKIDTLENVPSDLEIYVHDKSLETFHNLRSSDYQIDLPAGEYLERFEITFTAQALSVDELESNSINVLYANDTNNIVISNPQNLEIESVKIINMIGQVIMDFNKIDTNSTIELNTKNLSSGTYILNLETEIGEISKKVLVK
ncbi:M14 family zinc carboxypeptidase [Oceanihabitans sp.]|nr:M14 family zinc carboxypeptidase [Oceanihabitans sp.]